jgi:hypothetical protein
MDGAARWLGCSLFLPVEGLTQFSTQPTFRPNPTRIRTLPNVP